MKLKRLVPLMLSAALLLTSCAPSAPQQTLKVGIMPDLDSIPFMVAKQQGYLPDYVELEVFRSPVDRDSALFAGSLDGTISDALAACIALNGDFPVVITSKTDGRYGLLTHEVILSGKELEGKQVALSINTIIEYVTDCIVEGSGGDPALVEKVAVPKIPSRLELLSGRQIDAIAVPEPYVTAAVAQGAHLVSTSHDLGINPGVMLFTADAASQKQKEIKALYAAYNQAVDYIQANQPEAFMPSVIEELGLPETAGETQLPPYTHAMLPEEQEVLRARDWLLSKEIITTEPGYDDLVGAAMW